jgi:hypothetical protein
MKSFRTFRGFLRGHEPDEETYLHFSASLRITGDALDFGEFEAVLGVRATHSHRKGEKKGPRSPPFRNDMWSYRAPVNESEAPAKHIDALWAALTPHTAYLLDLKTRAKVDVFMGYRSNHDFAGIEIPHASLELFRQLQMSFSLSIIVG